MFWTILMHTWIFKTYSYSLQDLSVIICDLFNFQTFLHIFWKLDDIEQELIFDDMDEVLFSAYLSPIDYLFANKMWHSLCK